MKKLIRNRLKNLKHSQDLKNFTFPVELSVREKEIIKYIYNEKITMVGLPRMVSNVLATKYILDNNISGDFVECGVWKGGSILLVKMILEEYNSNKKVWLFDTFTGMTEPSEVDRNSRGILAIEKFNRSKNENHNEWCYSPVQEVKNNFIKAKVNMAECHFIEGDVFKTLPKYKNDIVKISFLRLDTDWYESTKIEMEQLYPLLVPKGVLIVDDFGHWEGSRKAVEEYFDKHEQYKPLLNLIDLVGRVGIKTH